MSPLPLFTVVTVCLNCATTLRDTLESVLAQDWDDFEYVVIDGGSTDGSLALIEDYARRFQARGIEMHWRSGPDQGIYDAMNKALGVARGAWVHFLGGDDFYYRPDALRQVAKVIGDGATTTNLVLSPVIQVDGRRQAQRVEHPLPISFLRWGMLPHQGAFIRTALHRELPFDQRYRLAADYDFFLALERRGALHAQTIALALVCFSTAGVSSRAGKQLQLEHLAIRARHGGWRERLSYLRKRHPWLRLLLWRIFFRPPPRPTPPSVDANFVLPDFVSSRHSTSLGDHPRGND